MVGEIITGIIAIVILIGGGVLLNSHPDNQAILAIVPAALTLVVTAYFSQRGTQKAQNGTITALTDLASRVGTIQAQAAQTPIPKIPPGGIQQ